LRCLPARVTRILLVRQKYPLNHQTFSPPFSQPDGLATR